MKDLSLHVLDIAENSVRAEATRIEIRVIEDLDKDVLTLEIQDDGKGMPPELASRSADPFFTTKPGRKFGLGLALLAQASREAEGRFEMDSAPGRGSRIRATFRHSHPDRKPLGDIATTLEVLVASNPGVDFLYEHTRGQDVTRFDTRTVTR